VDGQGVLRKSQAEAKDLHQILECVLPWQYRAFVGQFNVQHPNELAQMDRRGQRQLPSRELWPFMNEVAQACNRFYLYRLEAELGLLRQRSYHDASWADSISSLLQAIKGDLDAGRVFLLRVGRHSGAESMTLEGVRRIKIMQGKDSPPTILPESKTVWLAATETDQQTGLLPFGWLLVEIAPYEDQVLGCDALARICETRSVARHQLAAALRLQRSTIVAARLAIVEERRLSADRAAAQAAAEIEMARDAAARNAKREAMSPNRRSVEDFIAATQERAAQLRGGKDKPNTGFHQRAQQLASAALGGGDWTDEERMAAAAAIEEWLPKVVQLPDSKDAFKKLKLRALRGQV
jgi:CRISPR-associated protein Csm5